MALGLLFNVDVDGVPAHLAVLELADVEVAVGVSVGAFSIFFAVSELTPVLTTIAPLHLPFAVDLAVAELPNEGFIALLEIVSTKAFKETIHEVTLVVGTITP